LDFLSIPPISIKCTGENFFGGRTILWTKAKLGSKNVGMTEKMANWISKQL